VEGVIRGCGERKEGGVYFVVPLGEGGLPIEEAVICPPKEDPIGPHRGMKYVPQLNAVADWVGEVYYPSPLDFFEEAKRFGISRRVSRNFDFSAVNEKTVLLFHHAKAVVKNWEEVRDALLKAGIEEIPCPKGKHRFLRELKEPCLGLHYFLWDGEETEGECEFGRIKVRKVGSTLYPVYGAEGLPKPVFERGFFMFSPISRIEIVRPKSLAQYEGVFRAGIPVVEAEK
jgi:hypothetical protein